LKAEYLNALALQTLGSWPPAESGTRATWKLCLC